TFCQLYAYDVCLLLIARLFLVIRNHRRPTLFPYTTLFRSHHDAAAIDGPRRRGRGRGEEGIRFSRCRGRAGGGKGRVRRENRIRSEEHTSELQSRSELVCRLLLEKKKKCASTKAACTSPCV